MNSDLFEHPFSDAPDYRYLYLSTGLKTILNTTFEHVGDGGGLMLIEGDDGLGKTMIAKRLDYLLSLNRSHNPLYIRMTMSLHKTTFWKRIVKYFNLPILEKPVNNFSNLSQFLEKNYHRVMFDLIIDDADLMNSGTVEVIQELDSMRYSDERLIQMVVFGTQRMPNFNCFPVTKQVMMPLDKEDVRKMIEFRLRASGSSQLFSNTAIERIYNLSGGNPRKVVNWCRASLDSILERGKTFVDSGDVDEIVKIMGVPPY